MNRQCSRSGKSDSRVDCAPSRSRSLSPDAVSTPSGTLLPRDITQSQWFRCFVRRQPATALPAAFEKRTVRRSPSSCFLSLGFLTRRHLTFRECNGVCKPRVYPMGKRSLFMCLVFACDESFHLQPEAEGEWSIAIRRRTVI